MRHHYMSQLLCATILAACGGGVAGPPGPPPPPTPPTPPPPPPPAPTASLTGFVGEESNGAAVPGAVVTVGGVSATVAQNGQFSLPSVPIGVAITAVTAAGFDPVTRSVPITAGTNNRTFLLTRINTLYESGNFVMYLPSGVSSYRGVFFVLYGGNGDSRPMLRADFDFYQAIPFAGDVAGYRQSLMAFARAQGFAVMGTSTPTVLAGALPGEAVTALTSISGASGHPELTDAPFLLQGHSVGGCLVYEFALLVPDRVIGFIPTKSASGGDCLSGLPAVSVSVPAYLIVGELDAPFIAAASTSAFEQNRARGALWALGIERGAGHAWFGFHNLVFSWATAIAAQRLPENPPAGMPIQLRIVDEASGWLGDRTSFSVAGFPCFNGDKLSASWLPTQQTAREWQALSSPSGAGAVTVCGP